jgi:hypothetical protein
MLPSVLDEDVFPIVGWAGVSGDMVRPDTMCAMAEAGFTINHNIGGQGDPVALLDVAQEAGMRMLLAHPAYHVTGAFELTPEKKREIEDVVGRVRDHPALYAYYLRDEPRYADLPVLAPVVDLVRDLDPYHVPYVNHFPPVEGFGADSVEQFYEGVFGLLKPEFLSYDHYAICVATPDERKALADEPWFFAEEGIRLKPDFYSALRLFRSMSLARVVPFWAFTNALRHGYYPTPTEGHMRFQLMSALAYGALGLQYFTYAHGAAMVRPDGSTTETWEIARRINRDIHAWAPVLRTLHSRRVYHTGPLWPGTELPPLETLAADGDPACIGQFTGPDRVTYLLVVSKNPCSWSVVHLKMRGEEAISELDPRTGEWVRPWPYNPGRQPLTLAPGEGRLLRIGGESEGRS